MASREKRTCGDCGVNPGELHQPGCDVERCPYCGGQMLMCGGECEGHELDEKDLMPWTGTWPGIEECIEFGWFSKFIPDPNGIHGAWVRCSGDDPEADGDLNRLAMSAVWDKQAKRWRKREDEKRCSCMRGPGFVVGVVNCEKHGPKL